MIENAIVFALSSSVELAQEIVDYLGMPLGNVDAFAATAADTTMS